jgi:septal ring factor EnvC (AmiA/AmiB activator)
MNETLKKNLMVVLRYLLVFALGCIATGVWAHIRQLEQVRRADDRVAELQRNYDNRQRELEIRLGESERIVAGAREIVERAGSSLKRDAKNIREASRIIGDLYLQIQDIDRILNSGYPPGGGGGDPDGMADE